MVRYNQQLSFYYKISDVFYSTLISYYPLILSICIKTTSQRIKQQVRSSNSLQSVQWQNIRTISYQLQLKFTHISGMLTQPLFRLIFNKKQKGSDQLTLHHLIKPVKMIVPKKTISYNRWDEEEKCKLITLIREYINNNKKIDWQAVQKHFPNRTMQQCKSIYFNKLKSDYSITHKNYHTWSQDDAMYVYFYGLIFKSDWKLIQENYFKQFSRIQIVMKFLAVQRKYLQIENQLKEIQDGGGSHFDLRTKQRLYNYVTIWIYRHDAAHDGILPAFPELFDLGEQFPEYYYKFPIDYLEENFLHLMEDKFDLDLIQQKLIQDIGKPQKSAQSEIATVKILSNIIRQSEQ